LRLKINANGYLLNAKKFGYTRSVKHIAVAYEKYHCCSES
jgi:hypothetical protein